LARRADRVTESARATVLLVDDEDLLRDLMREALAAEGYRVIDASDGRAGLRAATTHAAAIDILVTDLVMPYVSGEQLATELRQHRPELRVLFLSGYPEAISTRHDGTISFLEKPFSLSALVARVRLLLGSASHAAGSGW
jgi:DNA-binding response OmpR family regulator